jgi:type IV fimbrial biogenesis protein FimT
MDKRYGCAGFTLVELMIVMAVVAILLSLAAPAFSGMVSSVRLSSASNSLFSSLLLARSEAIKRNSRAVLCKSANGDTCVSTGGWEQGWIVFHDANNNAALDIGETVLSREPALPGLIRLTGNNPLISYVSYTPMGTTSYTSGAFQAGTLTVCQQSALPVEARQIVISSSGRPRTVKTVVAQCPL